MFNAEIPSRAELPSTAQLVKSTIVAIVAAAVILVTVVLPAEYSIDPTGIGRALKLTQMGEIKKQLAIEAEVDRQRDRQKEVAPAQPDRRSSLPSLVVGLLVSSAVAHPNHASEDDGATAQSVPAAKSDETVISLKPGEGVEYKLMMKRGAKVEYSWKAEGGVVNYDMHGNAADGTKDEKSYKAERGVLEDKGVLTARADGGHGWFWRNRGSKVVTIVLRTSGAYAEIKRMM